MSDEIVKKMGKRLIGLSVQRYQRVEAIELDLSDNGQIAFLAGNNEQGKTSTLDAIDALFGGKKYTSEQPVRHNTGESSLIGITDAGFKVERTIQADGKTKKITISGPDGSTYQRPQELLDAFYNAHTRDALSFLGMDGKARVDAYKRVLGIDFSEADNKIEGFKTIRKEHNAQLKYAKERADRLPAYDESIAEQPQSSADLLAELQNAQNHSRRTQEIKDFITKEEYEINQLKEQLLHREGYLGQAKADLNIMNNSLPIRSEALIQQSINEIASVNLKSNLNKESFLLASEIRDIEAKVFRANESIDKIEEAKKKKLAMAKFPVPGIMFGDSDILVNGIPFEQEAKSKRIRISIAIAARLPGQLKTLLVRDASLLDPESMAAAKQAIIEEDCQAVFEIINPNDAQGLCFVIENGEVKEVRK